MSIKSEQKACFSEIKKKKSDYEGKALLQKELGELYDELEKTPFTSGDWNNSPVYRIGNKIAQKVEWVDEHANKLLFLLCDHALNFKHTKRNDIMKTMYASYCYLQEYGDPEFVDPVIALMGVAYKNRDLEMAGRCALMLGQAGISKKASEHVKWAREKGLIQKNPILNLFSM